MKLSVWSSYYIDLSPEAAIAELARHGIHYCELSDEHGEMLLQRGDPKNVGAAFKAYAEQQGVQITQGHLWLKVKLCTDSDNTVTTLYKWLDLFEAIGIRSAVLHTDTMNATPNISVEERFCRNTAVIQRLTDYLHGRDMVICLENLCVPGLNDTADDLLRIIHAINSPNLGICLDTGHLNISEDKDQGAFIRKAGDYLKALHIADNDTTCDQHLMPFGRGTVKFNEVLPALQEIGYNGLFNFEIPGENRTTVEIRGHKLDYLVKAMTCYEAQVLGK